MRIQKIIGKKVTLQSLNKKHFIDYHRMFSPMVRKILGLPETATLEETSKFLAQKVADIKNDKIYFFCIFDNRDNKLIGSIEIRGPGYKEGQLGAWLNENYWGNGRYQEALKLILENYFETKHKKFVNAHVKTDNLRSLKAHQKYGFEIIREFEKNGKKHYEIVISREGSKLKP